MNCGWEAFTPKTSHLEWLVATGCCLVVQWSERWRRWMKLSAEWVSMIEFTSRLGASSLQEFDEVSVRSLMKPESTSASRDFAAKIIQQSKLLKERLLPFFSCSSSIIMHHYYHHDQPSPSFRTLAFVLSSFSKVKSPSKLLVHTYIYICTSASALHPSFLHQGSRIWSYVMSCPWALHCTIQQWSLL